MTAVPEEGSFTAPPLVFMVQPSGSEYRVLPEEDLKDRRMPDPERDDSRPIAYMFRPTAYQIVPPERLDEWEKLMTERVGLNPGRHESGERQGMRNRLPSVSFCCNGGISMSCACDSDEV